MTARRVVSPSDRELFALDSAVGHDHRGVGPDQVLVPTALETDLVHGLRQRGAAVGYERHGVTRPEHHDAVRHFHRAPRSPHAPYAFVRDGDPPTLLVSTGRQYGAPAWT